MKPAACIQLSELLNNHAPIVLRSECALPHDLKSMQLLGEYFGIYLSTAATRLLPALPCCLSKFHCLRRFLRTTVAAQDFCYHIVLTMSLFHDSSSLVTILCVFASLVWRVEGYSDTSCCETADSKFPGAFVNTTVHPLTSNVICGQTYSKTTPPAPNAWVSYDFCTANCAGIGLSRPSDTGAWIGPLVQFILPAVLFSATIPRRKVLTFWALDKWAWEFIEGRRYLEILTFVPRKVWSAVVAVLDSSAWVIVIVTAAGPMLVGGLYEALFDHLILKTLRESAAEDDSSPEDVKVHLQLLVIMALGNLREDGDPIENTIAKLSVASGQHASAKKEQQEHSKTRLQALMSAQLPFGTAIGAPVLFYLGAFVFTVVDLLNDPSDENSAISLAFGVSLLFYCIIIGD